MSSSKWRAIQHRHRYTYSSVVFPPSFIEALNQTPSLPFFTELKHLASLNSIYTQVEHAKNIASAFTNLLSNPNSDANTCSLAAKFYLEVLFLENSLPLHKTLASSGLSKVKNFQDLVKNGFRELCEEYGGRNAHGNGKGKKRFCVSRAALTVMGTPKLGYLVEVVEECAVMVGWDVVSGLNAVVSETNDWSRPSPLVMEQCQEALSCMYYLLQRFPHRFSDASREEDVDIFATVFVTVFNILKSQAFPRDCFVAAGVTFFAALLVCLSDEELGLFIMGGIFCQTSIIDSKTNLQDVIRRIPYNGDLVSEISNFTPLSRLCLIRGILTAVSRTVLNTKFLVSRTGLDGVNGSEDDRGVTRTILYDGILPELCYFSENPVDSHFNFHSLTVLQICLQQIKTLLQNNVSDTAESCDLITEHTGNRILRIVWSNLEDPLSQTVKQVHLIFDLFLDIQASLSWEEGGEKNKLFLKKIAQDLLRLGPRCKGRYVPLASLTRRLGAKAMLDMGPKLIFETMNAYNDDDVCCAVTTFLKTFLENLRDENWSSHGIDDGYAKYRDDCLPPFLCGLASGVTKLRSNLNTYALPILLELDVDGLFPMLASIGVGLSDEESDLVYPQLHISDFSLGLEQRVAVLISLLKVSRLNALIEGDIDWYKNNPHEASVPDMGKGDAYCAVSVKRIIVKIAADWLVLALTHSDDLLRIDAAEFFFLNPKTASLPSSLELSLMRVALPLNMRSCSTAFQMKWTSLFRKFFSRVRTALERQLKQKTWCPGAVIHGNGDRPKDGTIVAEMAEELFNLMKWLSSFLFFSCYPSAPYERKIMAMELFLVMLNVWSVVPQSEEESNIVSSLYPYSKGLTSSGSCLLLVGSIVDSWDRLRENSFRILLHFPTPLPGFSSTQEVQKAILWAKKLVCSPRVRESDAGALTLRLIFRKYVVELSWIVNLERNLVAFHAQSESPNGLPIVRMHQSPVIEYIRSLVDWLHVVVDTAEKDLSEACKKSFVHGILLTLRYTFDEVDWNSKAVLSSIADMKVVLEKLLELVMRITSLALWVVSADAWHLPEDMEEMVDDDAFALEVPTDEVSLAALEENDVENVKLMQDTRSSEQIVLVGCWLAMKEISLLLGTIIRKIPLPTGEASAAESPDVKNADVSVSDGVFDLKQLEAIGTHFLEVLLKMKHNGAIDKTRAGFTALCNRLLCSNDPRLCKLTELWMEQLMERTIAKGQTVDDLLRRSAGIPAAFIALFLAEPEGSPKRLLPRALRWLLDVANGILVEKTTANSCFTSDGLLTNSSLVNDKENLSKIRDEGVIPTVHAFNVLRAAFNDTNLATDTSGFSAEALIVSVRSFSSPYWEVRNSACLAYTALVRRTIGFLNVHKRESARRSITGLEFFHRYPSLHSFLIHELKVATESLLDGSPGELESNLAKVVHPSLCPILILLSRLKPSAIASETGDTLDPFLFMPFIRKCSIQSNFRIRVLASKAITGLVSNEKLPVVLLNIASQLPCTETNISLSYPPNSVNPEKSALHNSNSVHGMLLQLNSLLNNNCRNLVDSSKKDKILYDLIQILSLRSWIGKTQVCSCPVLNSCFLNVLDTMLSIARSCPMSESIDAIWKLVWELSSDFFHSEDSRRTSFYDPTRVELRKQVALSYFNCIYQTSKEVAEEDPLIPWRSSPQKLLRVPDLKNALSGFQERLMSCITDASYEVRLTSLKWLFWTLKSTGSKFQGGCLSYFEIKTYFLSNMDLQRTLMDLIAGENNHKCTYYILKILYHWNFLEYDQGDQQQVSLRSVDWDENSLCYFWEKLVSLYKVNRHPKTRQMLLCCMGICVKKFGTLFLGFLQDTKTEERNVSSQSDDLSLTNFYNCISYFADLVQLHGDASEPVNMRKAAAESVIASGLLDQAKMIGPLVLSNKVPVENPCLHFNVEEAVSIYAHKILMVWFTSIKLLEDEDDELRWKLALDVQKCIGSLEGQNAYNAGVVPSQVEKVIELSFEHLSSIFGHWIDYFDTLCNWILNSANSVVSVVSRGDFVRRVFDKEIDNHHEEKLMLCQICCSHLESLPIKFGDEHKLMDYLHGWRKRFRDSLLSFANIYVRQQGVDWIGGIGNHKDAFLPMYANLLAFYALSNCIFRGDVENSRLMLNEVLELEEILHPFVLNPMVSNLYLLVIESHEKMAGESPSLLAQNLRGKTSAWSGFNPYFLLR
ncbi:OLC1v1009547C1 [Oldenlandia corymbosa var. corymbosa]|uniref:OLC1v1009547C1 n=1 Tax=Oldenlandia corymbosa var. corymbosa TaxID=529605 RepID=A0AAV1DRL9_OLDCO|nr:OLC1v1009547C1 [Oldenlandia corymbosa var. corymbosa]